MNRRDFLGNSLTGTVLASGAGGQLRMASGESEHKRHEYYELRLYQVRRGRQHSLLDEFFRTSWLPAMTRLGIGPIGVFDVTVGPENPTIYVLIPYQSLELFAGAPARVSADAEFQRTGAAVINAPATDPAYGRVESSLMLAFDGMPKIQPPNFGARQASRIFELRTYESHSRKASSKKIEMFNQAEIAIFRRTGLQPVFFGETLIGQKLPQLTYMLAFDSMESHDKNWAAFVADPEWKKLSTTPGYTDGEIVSNISNVFLRPTSYSQI